jgi:transcription antitermination factor NusG
MTTSLKEPHLSENGEALSRVDAKFVSAADAPALARWYALRTQARHEKRVREHLQSRKIAVFLPLYEQIHRWRNGCKARVELPLFPGYIFVEMEYRERIRVLEVPGTIDFVGGNQGPWPLDQVQIQALRDNMPTRHFEPHEYLTVGQKVRIAKGPLTNLTGILVRKNTSLRVVLLLDAIMQGVSVEVDADEIEAVAPHGDSNPAL